MEKITFSFVGLCHQGLIKGVQAGASMIHM